jgi:nucleoside-diphosphate-sugar epimerase
MRYADFVRAVAAASGQRPPRIVALPAGTLVALASVLRYVPFLPRIRAEEIRRLLEDKSFDVRPMTELLGVEPVSLAEGLARTFTERS